MYKKLQERYVEVIQNQMNSDEHIIASLLVSKCDPPSSNDGKYLGILIVSERRLFFAGEAPRAVFSAKDVVFWEISEVFSIDCVKQKGILTGHILKMTLPGTQVNFLVYEDNIKLEQFTQAFQRTLESVRRKPVTSSQFSSSTSDEIKKLFELKQLGILTDEEFNKAKNNLL